MLNHMFLLKNKIFPSGFKKFYSTKAALLWVSSDLPRFTDRNWSLLLILLDFSASFQTLNHSLLFNCFKSFIWLSSIDLCFFSLTFLCEFLRLSVILTYYVPLKLVMVYLRNLVRSIFSSHLHFPIVNSSRKAWNT